VIDVHTHILPGLDDGPGDMDSALELCRVAVVDGIHTMVATPHAFHDLFHVTREETLRGVDCLRQRLRTEGVPLRVEAGSEAFVTPDLPERVAHGDILTIADNGKYLLIEFPANTLPEGIDDLLFSLRLMGLTAIVSHPERNSAVQADVQSMARIVKAGNLVQLTASSLVGHFGEETYRCAVKLLQSGLCHFVASDCHSMKSRPPILSAARKEVESLTDRTVAARLFEHNPRSILAGEEIDGLRACAAPGQKAFTGRFRNWIRRMSP